MVWILLGAVFIGIPISAVFAANNFFGMSPFMFSAIGVISMIIAVLLPSRRSRCTTSPSLPTSDHRPNIQSSRLEVPQGQRAS